MGDLDLIPRCEACEYCPLEDMMTPYQRRWGVLDEDIPEKHIHRETVEQICGRQYDDVCKLKHAVERLSCDDRVGAQNAAVAISLWDWGIKYDREVRFPEGSKEWTAKKDLGRGREESYAERFDEVWSKGIRGTRQTLTILGIYERVISKDYDAQIKRLGILMEESKARHEGKLNI